MNVIKLHTIHPRFLLVSALLLVCYLFPSTIYAACPESLPGFEYLGEINDHQYYISENTATWSAANDIAFSYGGYLAAITSAEENAFILENALLLNAGPKAHIGLNDYDNEGNFVWSSGESISYNNVDVTFNDIDKNNVSINLWQNGGGWTLESKWLETHFIIELPCDEILPASKVEILSYSCPNDFPIAGNTITFNVTVKNQDTIPSLPQTFGFYQSITGDSPLADHLIGQTSVGVLMPNEIAVLTLSNIAIPNPFYFPGFSMNNTQWGLFYVKRYTNITGTSLEPDFNNPMFDIFCKTYSTDISVSFTNSNYKFGDEGLVDYEGVITNNGPATAYNLKAIVGKTAYGSIPSITTVPFETILTFDDADETKIICIDELAVGASITVDVFYDFDNATLPDSFDVSFVSYSEHLLEIDNSNNSVTETFIYDPNVSDDCPSSIIGYEYLGQYNSNRYFVSEAVVHWWEADSLAAEVGGELTAIETHAENVFLLGYLEESAWIGMSDFEQEGNFVWSNNQVVDFNNIQGVNGPALDYVSFNHWNGIWVLNKASNKKKFVIEVPCNEVPGSFADLTAESFELDALSAPQLSTVGYSFTLKNIGNSDAANYWTGNVWLSTDSILSPDDTHGGDLGTGFTGSDTEAIFTAADGLAIPWNLLLGDYFVILELDNTNIIEEFNEANNIIVATQKLEVTGNPCTLLPNVTDGDMTVYGIPQGFSSFILYGAASNIVYSYYCSNDCPDQIEIDDLPDGDYTVAFYHWSSDWLEECEVFLDLSIFLGGIAGMTNNNDAEFDRNVPFDQLPFAAIKDQTLYPNPADDYVITTIESHIDREAQIEFYDINGRLVKTKLIQLQKGFQSLEFNITNLSSGVHHLVLKSGNQIISTQRFIKN